MSALTDLYERDFYAWTRMQARELRRMRDPRRNVELDLAHLIEEVFDLGSALRRACRSQVARILEHFLKLAYSSQTEPRRGWRLSIVEARATLDDDLTATLRRDLERQLQRSYRRARRIAAEALEGYGDQDAARLLPESCPYTLDDVLRHDWYPEPVSGGG